MYANKKKNQKKPKQNKKNKKSPEEKNQSVFRKGR